MTRTKSWLTLLAACSHAYMPLTTVSWSVATSISTMHETHLTCVKVTGGPEVLWFPKATVPLHHVGMTAHDSTALQQHPQAVNSL